MILPMVDQASVYSEFDWNVPIFAAANVQPRERHLAVFLCPSDTVSDMGFVRMGPEPERYAMASYAANFGPPDLDENQEQRDGLFSRNSRTRMADVRDGLSNTLMVGERMNGPFRGGQQIGNHFEYETTWAGAVREFSDPTDDHGHMVLFQTGHVPNAPRATTATCRRRTWASRNSCWGTARCGRSARASTWACTARWGRGPGASRSVSFEVAGRTCRAATFTPRSDTATLPSGSLPHNLPQKTTAIPDGTRGHAAVARGRSRRISGRCRSVWVAGVMQRARPGFLPAGTLA
jgi:hypothetical protein